MAEVRELLDQEQLSCSVCLDLLKDPVTIPCGHSYCMACIAGCWAQETRAGVHSCPQCRQTFEPRPALNTNIMLAEVLRKVKRTEHQAACAGPGDVECDFCSGTKKKAVRSCLVCLASYCEAHLQPHYESPTFKKHKLTDAAGQLQQKICSLHDKLLEIYCHSDRRCICYLCTMDEHRGHNTVSAVAGRTEEQKRLEATQKQLLQWIQQRESELQQMRQAADSVKCSAQVVVEDIESIFSEMICSLKKRRSEVVEGIRAQEKAALSQAEGVLEQLEQEINELKRRNAEMQQLSETEDHVHFLQKFQSLCDAPGSEMKPSININPHRSFVNIKKAISELTVQLEDIWRKEFKNISREVKEVSVLLPAEPKTREDFLKYAYTGTLDPNTANTAVNLLDGNRSASTANQLLLYPYHPERFDSLPQVLCTEGLSTRSYWEVQWSGDGVYIAVSYKGIDRNGKGDNCMFGRNDKSWSLFCSRSHYAFYHKNNATVVSVAQSSTIGVYLDYRAGTLSFYSVSDEMSLLHRVETKFVEPVYPGFSLQPHTNSIYDARYQPSYGRQYPLCNTTNSYSPITMIVTPSCVVGSRIQLVKID